MDSAIASSAKLSQDGRDVKVTIKTPSSIDTSDVKVFSLKKDTVNKKPYRIVVDVQKKGAVAKPAYYGKKPSQSAHPAKMYLQDLVNTLLVAVYLAKQLLLTQDMVVVILVLLDLTVYKRKTLHYQFLCI